MLANPVNHEVATLPVSESVNDRHFFGCECHQFQKLSQPFLLVTREKITLVAEPPTRQLIPGYSATFASCCPPGQLLSLLHPEPMADPGAGDLIFELRPVLRIDQLARELTQKICPAGPARDDGVQQRKQEIRCHHIISDEVDDTSPEST